MATHSHTVVALIHLQFMQCKGYTFSYNGRPNTSRIYAMQGLHISNSGRPNTSRINAMQVVALIHLEFMPSKGYSGRPYTSRVYAKDRLHILL
jgi:hypothetical protein